METCKYISQLEILLVGKYNFHCVYFLVLGFIGCIDDECMVVVKELKTMVNIRTIVHVVWQPDNLVKMVLGFIRICNMHSSCCVMSWWVYVLLTSM